MHGQWIPTGYLSTHICTLCIESFVSLSLYAGVHMIIVVVVVVYLSSVHIVRFSRICVCVCMIGQWIRFCIRATIYYVMCVSMMRSLCYWASWAWLCVYAHIDRNRMSACASLCIICAAFAYFSQSSGSHCMRVCMRTRNRDSFIQKFYFIFLGRD